MSLSRDYLRDAKQRGSGCWRRVVLLGVALACLTRGAFAADAPATKQEEAERLFTLEVLPLLKTKCFVCHGDDPKGPMGDYDMRGREKLLAGGESGEPAVVPGDPRNSPLFQAVRWKGLEMPPKQNDRLTPDQIETLGKWIAAGAPWPDAERQRSLAKRWAEESGAGVIVKNSGGLNPQWTNRRYDPEDLWAYRPVQATRPPVIAPDNKSVVHPIDAFLGRKMSERQLSPAPRADARELIRRATFDLTGLPPTPEQVEAFVGGAEGYPELVDELLHSPHYGQRMAQLWLDVARYADTSGYSNDWERPHAWRYRDYVIRAFNQDKRFDQFIVEQIAGDELAAAAREPSEAAESAHGQAASFDVDPGECLVAVGFLRMGPWEQTGMSVAAVTRQLWLDDVTNSVGETFLGHALRCAKCHDHKFDPIPTRDYYRFQAVFASTQFADAPAPLAPHENIAAALRSRALVEQQLGGETVEAMTKLEGDNAFSRITNKLGKYRELALQRCEPVAFSVRVAKPEPISILIGGALERPGDPVEPGVLSAWANSDSHPVPRSAGGRRLALARWIAAADNPLTARVIVNRVWQWHFGRGLVATPNNFGKTGAKPSHPELLDWLADWFVRREWSIKELHRLIMTSQAYQRGTRHPRPQRVAELDPANNLLSYFRPRRLMAEELRDACLAVCGELSRQAGGPGTFPEIKWEVALQPRHIMGGIAPSYRPSSRREDRNRRSIYAFRYRGLANPMFEVFNRPNPDLSCERRDETTVTPQAFEWLNGPFTQACALALAARLGRAADASQQVDAVYRQIFARPPSEEERRRAVDHLARMVQHHRRQQLQPESLPSVVIREMIAEETGVPFRWREKLLLKDYQPDVKPWEVSAETRALADLCLVLLNSSEFFYVY